MTRPVVMDVIARDKATKTYDNVSRSVKTLAKDTNRANDSIHRSAKKAGDANRTFAKVSGRAYATTAGHLRGLAVLSGGVFLTIAAGAAVAGKAFLDAATTQQKANRQTAAVIKSTGGAANVTAKQIGDLSSALSTQTGIQDDVIQSSANMLLTFTNIRNAAGKNNDIFNQATKVVTDMSVALGQDGAKSAIQLGKALNDPIKGVTALQRVGVTFTAKQKDTIKRLVESGRTLDAQKLILKELNKEFGGSAAAQATAGAKMAAAWDNVKETIGNLLLPVLEKVSDWFVKTGAPAIQKAVAKTSAWVKAHWTEISAVFQTVWTVIQVVFKAWQAAVKYIYTVILPAIVGWIKQHWPEISAAIKKAWKEIQPTLLSLWVLLQALWKQILQPLVAWIVKHWPQISATLKVAAIIIGTYLIAMSRAIRIFAAVVTWMVNHVWGPQFRLMLHIISGVAAAVIRIFNGLKAAWNATFTAVKTVGTSILNWFKSLPGKLVAQFIAPWLLLRNVGKSIINGLWTGVKSIWTNVVNWFKDLPGKILSALGIASPPKWAIEAGTHIMKGILRGIVQHAGGAVGFMGRWAAGLAGSVGAGFGKDVGMINTRGVSQAVWRAMEITGVPATWFDPIMRRIRFESGGNPMAINLTDINAQRGDPSRGLMQTIMGTFRSFHHPGTSWNIYDPVANVAAAIDYIRSRYGSIFNIDPPIQGYEKGTAYVPRTGLALLHKGEQVTPAGTGVTARGLAAAVADALSGATFQFDGDGLATLVTKRQAVYAAKGPRR